MFKHNNNISAFEAGLCDIHKENGSVIMKKEKKASTARCRTCQQQKLTGSRAHTWASPIMITQGTTKNTTTLAFILTQKEVNQSKERFESFHAMVDRIVSKKSGTLRRKETINQLRQLDEGKAFLGNLDSENPLLWIWYELKEQDKLAENQERSSLNESTDYSSSTEKELHATLSEELERERRNTAALMEKIANLESSIENKKAQDKELSILKQKTRNLDTELKLCWEKLTRIRISVKLNKFSVCLYFYRLNLYMILL